MKPNHTNQPGKIFSLQKSTVMRLSQEQSQLIKGGLAAEELTTTGGGDMQTCGIACGDCMSTLQTLRCITQTFVPA